MPRSAVCQTGGEGRKLAFLVGVNEYDHAHLSPLRFAENDVNELAQVLRSQKFDVVTLTPTVGRTNAERAATKSNIERQLQKLLKGVTRRDLILVGLAGHGLELKDDAHSYFCPQDANRVVENGHFLAPESLLSLEYVVGKLDQSGIGEKILLVDACRNEPSLSGYRGASQLYMNSLPLGFAVMLSCLPQQMALEHEALGSGHGVFFYYVIEGLRGQAADRSGEVTWSDLTKHVQRHVPSKVRELSGGDQEPNMQANLGGITILARIQEMKVKNSESEELQSPQKTPKAMPAVIELENQPAPDTKLARSDTNLKPHLMDPADPGSGPRVLRKIPRLTSSVHSVPAPLSIPFAEREAISKQNEWVAYLGYGESVRNSIGMDFRLIPPGEFLMGSPPEESGRSPDEGQVKVVVSRPYWFARTEVTQSQWLRVMSTTPWKGKPLVEEHHDAPAVFVSWLEAREFCRRLSLLEANQGRADMRWEFQLPTEAEWEWACRAGNAGRQAFEVSTTLAEHAWFKDNASDNQEWFPHRVASKKPNVFGLCDMVGNVSEWCQDAYSPSLPGGSDPLVVGGGSDRVLRGGSWSDWERECRPAARSKETTQFRGSSYVGFRPIGVPVDIQRRGLNAVTKGAGQ